MQTLKSGSTGTVVESWQNFLVGRGNYWIDVDGVFGHDTIEATKDFQKEVGLNSDGEVGQITLKAAVAAGFPDPDAPVVETVEGIDVLGPNWPPKPDFGPLSFMDRAKLFGTFSYVAAPVGDNPEAIKITDGWDKRNIVMVDIPQLQGKKGCPKGKVEFHAKGAKQLQGLWAAWEAAGLLPLILTFDGGWVARFVRGSTKYLSNHSYGTAFDVNAKWNALGAVPALVSKEGSVRKLVEIANQHGFYWLGHAGKRPDGMHFEIAKLIP